MKKLFTLSNLKFLSVLMITYFLPNLIYLGVKYEVIHFTPPVSKVLGVELELKDGWFLYDNKTLSIVQGDKKLSYSAIYYYKNDWIHPWSSSTIVVSNTSNLMADVSVEDKIKKYCSIVSCNFTNPMKPLGMYDPRYDLTFTVFDKDGLDNIVSIKPKNPVESTSTLK